MSSTAEPPRTVLTPVLIYHSVSDDPPGWIAPFTIDAPTFRRHLELIADSGRRAITVSEYVDRITAATALEEPVVVVTFDDGFADFATHAAPAMAELGLPSTLYLTTGAVGGSTGSADSTTSTRLPPARMLDWAQVGELGAMGVEIGAHSHTHPQLDVIARAEAVGEIARSRDVLEQRLGERVRSFAYPHGYSDSGVRRAVAEAGFDSGCAVMNCFSACSDDPYRVARLMLRSDTSSAQLEAWLAGSGAGVAPERDRVRTRLWRAKRRLSALTGR